MLYKMREATPLIPLARSDGEFRPVRGVVGERFRVPPPEFTSPAPGGALRSPGNQPEEAVADSVASFGMSVFSLVKRPLSLVLWSNAHQCL